MVDRDPSGMPSTGTQSQVSAVTPFADIVDVRLPEALPKCLMLVGNCLLRLRAKGLGTFKHVRKHIQGNKILRTNISKIIIQYHEISYNIIRYHDRINNMFIFHKAIECAIDCPPWRLVSWSLFQSHGICHVGYVHACRASSSGLLGCHADLDSDELDVFFRTNWKSLCGAGCRLIKSWTKETTSPRSAKPASVWASGDIWQMFSIGRALL